MKNKHILFSLAGIIITSLSYNISAMEQGNTPALPPVFYTLQAKSYIQSFKDSKHCKQNLTHKLDWFEDIQNGKVTKVKEITTCRDPHSKQIVGFGVKTSEYKLSDIQKHIDIVVDTVLAHKDSDMGNVLYNYNNKLKMIFKFSLFKRIGSYWGPKIPLYEQWNLTPVNAIVFKKLFDYFGNFNNFRSLFLIEAIHFTQQCLDQLEQQSNTTD